jgi:hypothetical protein
VLQISNSKATSLVSSGNNTNAGRLPASERRISRGMLAKGAVNKMLWNKDLALHSVAR